LIAKAVLKWLRENLPSKLVSDLLPTFSELFQVPLEEEAPGRPSRSSSIVSTPELQVALKKLNLTYVPGTEFQLKELSKGLHLKDCVIVVGEPSCKSSLISLLALTQSEEVKLHHINKTTIAADLLFGGRLKKGPEAEYTEGKSTIRGILAEILESKGQHSSSRQGENVHSSSRQLSEKQLAPAEAYQNWLVLEGYDLNEVLETPATEQLLNYLIRNKKLLYNRGKFMQMPSQCRIIIECCSLSNIDPSIIVGSIVKTV